MKWFLFCFSLPNSQWLTHCIFTSTFFTLLYAVPSLPNKNASFLVLLLLESRWVTCSNKRVPRTERQWKENIAWIRTLYVQGSLLHPVYSMFPASSTSGYGLGHKSSECSQTWAKHSVMYYLLWLPHSSISNFFYLLTVKWRYKRKRKQTAAL